MKYQGKIVIIIYYIAAAVVATITSATILRCMTGLMGRSRPERCRKCLHNRRGNRCSSCVFCVHPVLLLVVVQWWLPGKWLTNTRWRILSDNKSTLPLKV